MSYEPSLIERVVPLWAFFLASLVIVMLSIRVGLVVAHASRGRRDPGEGEPVGSVVGATLGLLAFMLAFTFGIAVSRRELRRDLLLEEVNSIGTTYLRADLIPEPLRSEARGLLKRYVDLRVELAGQVERVPAMVEEAKGIQRRLWEGASSLRDAELKNADIASLYVDSLNETIDLQTKRLVVMSYRIPVIIWGVLGALTILTMTTVGYQFGQKGSYNWFVNLGLAMSFSAVLLVIVDLDRVTSGFLHVSQQPMVQLQADMASK